MQRKTMLLGVVIFAGLAILTAGFYLTKKETFQGAVIDPPWSAPEIRLTDHNGKSFSLSSERGKVVLLYFGYVNCPDECPLTMAHLKLARASLGDRAKDVQVVMVSTDPARDTPEALKNFMEYFDPSFRGLTGATTELEKVWKDYGVDVEDGGETHSTYLYLIDPVENVRETFLPSAEANDIAIDVNLLLKGN
jgi:protein SCO1/2